MKIGYPCVNNSLGCTSSHTFQLKSYSEKRLVETIEKNLACLQKTLAFNLIHKLLFFRITSDLVPFASHPICRFNWQKKFENQFQEIGDFIKENGMRISMHPDQFTLINSLDNRVFENSVRELVYHAQVLDLMELDTSAKIQIHVGGVYGDKNRSMIRFVNRFKRLDGGLQRRLVIENDDRCYSLSACLEISIKTGVPVLFDIFHHQINSSGETIQEALRQIAKTWKDALPMVDYSSQKLGYKMGGHTETIDLKNFQEFLEMSKPYDFDIMLEIKDKEVSALKALEIALKDNRTHVLTRNLYRFDGNC